MLVQSLLHLVHMLMRDACKKDADDSEDELDSKDNKNLAETDNKRNLRPWLIVRFSSFVTIVNFTYSFIHSGYFYSASSSPLPLRGTPNYCIDTVSELARRSAAGNYE